MATTVGAVRLLTTVPFRVYQTDLSGITAEDAISVTLKDDGGSTQYFSPENYPVVFGHFTTAPPIDGTGGVIVPVLTGFSGSAGTVALTLAAGGASDGSAAAAVFTDAVFRLFIIIRSQGYGLGA